MLRDYGSGVAERVSRPSVRWGGQGTHRRSRGGRAGVGCVFFVCKRCCGPGGRIHLPGLMGDMTFHDPSAIAPDIQGRHVPHLHGHTPTCRRRINAGQVCSKGGKSNHIGPLDHRGATPQRWNEQIPTDHNLAPEIISLWSSVFP